MPLSDYLPQQQGSALSKYIKKPDPPGVLESFLPAAGRGLVSGFVGLPAMVAGGLGRLGEAMVPGQARGPITPQSLVGFGLEQFEKEDVAQKRLKEAIRATKLGQPIDFPEYMLLGLPPEVAAQPGAEDPLVAARGETRELRSPVEGLVRGVAYAPDVALLGGASLARRSIVGAARGLAKYLPRQAVAPVAESVADVAKNPMTRAVLDLEPVGPGTREALLGVGQRTVESRGEGVVRSITELRGAAEETLQPLPGAAYSPAQRALRLEEEAMQAGKPVSSWLSPRVADDVPIPVRAELWDRSAQRIVDGVSEIRRGREVGPLEPRRQSGVFTKLFRDETARPGVLTEYAGPEVDTLVNRNIGIEGKTNYLGMRNAHNDHLRESVRAASGFDPDDMRAERWLREHMPLETRDQGILQLTRDEAAHIVAMAKDANNRAFMIRDGLHLSRHDLPETVNITARQLKNLEALVDRDGAGRLAQSLFDRMPVVRGEINPVTRRTLGRDIATRERYFPRSRHTGAEDKPLKTFEDLRKAHLDSYGHVKERAKDATAPIRVGNLTEEYAQYTDNMSRIAGYMGPVTDAFETLGNADAARALKALLGENGYSRVIDAINLETIPLRATGSGDTVMRKFLRNFGSAKLGYRLQPLGLNPSGWFVSMAYQPGGVRNFLVGGPKALSQWRRVEETAKKFSPIWRDRYEHDFMHQVTAGMTATPKRRFGPKTIPEQSLTPLEWSDKVGAVVRWGAAEEHIARTRPNLVRGSDDFYQAAADEWADMMFKGENTSHGMELPGALARGRRNPFFGAATMFQSSTTKIYSLLPRAIGQARKGDLTGAINSVLGFTGAIAYSTMVRLSMKAIRSGSRPGALLLRTEEDREKVLKQAAQEVAGMPPLIGNAILAPIARLMMGEGAFRFPATASESAITEVFEMAEAIHGAQKAYFEEQYGRDGERKFNAKLMKALDKMATVGATFTGLPYEGAKQTFFEIPRAQYEDIRKKDPELAEALDAGTTVDTGEVAQSGYMMFRAVNDGDSALFRKSLERRKKAGSKMTMSNVLSSIRNRKEFRGLSKYEPRPGPGGIEMNAERDKLSPAVLARVDTQLEYRDRLLEAAKSMARENEDLMSGFVGDASDYLERVRRENQSTASP